MENIYTPIVDTPVNAHTNAQAIWTNLFAVTLDYCDTISSSYARIFGMPTVGDPGLDREMQHHSVDTFLTIDALVEHYKQGHQVKLRRHEDSKQIYDIISAYLQDWKNKLKEGINVGNPPIDDLILLDRYAAVVFPFAVQHFEPDFFSSAFVQGITGGGKWISRDQIFKAPLDQQEPEVAPHKHQSLEETFTQSVAGLGAKRW